MIQDGTKAVAAAGTAEAQSATVVKVHWITVQALVDNTGNVFLGASTIADGRGVELTAGQSHHFPAPSGAHYYDLSTFYADVDTNGDGVSWLAGAV